MWEIVEDEKRSLEDLEKEIIASQEELGEEFEDILHNNLSNLYEE